MDSLFLVASADNTPMIMCEKHAKIFEKICIVAQTPHTIYELDDEEQEKAKCHACSLLPDIIDNQPRIILH